jgi:nucleoside-diphosphate-sugar epimerase
MDMRVHAPIQTPLERPLAGASMKIVITGGMGYIASALSEIYAKQPEHQVTLVDRRFIPERVAGLAENFRYIQGDVEDGDLMARVLDGADVLHILNAEVEAEKSKDRKDAVWHGNFELPKRLIEACSSSTRIMFASSGNVFGGVDESKKYMGLTEEDPPSPRFPYAESKRAVEELLLASDKNFTILRFGTNYGYAPGVRFNLVTNIFTRKALLGEELTVHGQGTNYRPTCCVKDCARALEFLSRNEDARGEIFHVVSKSYQIRELAETVVRVCDTGATTTYIDKVVPFSAYALSNDKILGLGFEFEWPLERAIADMKEQLRGLIPE